ncbi:MAG: hypothetical protein IPG39_19545 [Bacteroidetes bacterium]|nr:hypothetical protein [Bacteroidota bacterium]
MDQILTSSPFYLPIARSGITGDKVLEFRNLFLKDDKNDSERIDLKYLRVKLKRIFLKLENQNKKGNTQGIEKSIRVY